MSRASVSRFLAGCLCAGWCLLFLRCESTEKSMVRALYLSEAGQNTEVILLYQAPEAQADAAEASAALQAVRAEGPTVEKALAQAQKKLPQAADYRLCDYLLVPQDAPDTLLEEYEQLVLTRRCGRTAVRICCTGLDAGQLLEQQKADDSFPDQLLAELKRHTKQLPRLYQHREAMLLPLLTEQEGTPLFAEKAMLFTPEARRELDAETARMAWLLAGTEGTQTFWLEGQQIKIRRCSVSVSLQEDAADLRLDCQLEAGEPEPSPEQTAALQALAEQTAEALRQQGADLLSLQQRMQLQYGEEAPETENACPEFRADVRFIKF